MNAEKRQWTEASIIEEVESVMGILGISHFPTHSEMDEVTGGRALSNAVAKHGGTSFFSQKMQLPLKDSYTNFGYSFECRAVKDIQENTGLESVQMKPGYPYDILTNGNIKVDVKVSKPLYRMRQNAFLYSFGLAKKYATCDIYIFYCLGTSGNVDKTVILPSCLTENQTQIGMGIQSRWDVYIDRWDFFITYKKFYDELHNAKILIPKRRTNMSKFFANGM